MEQRSPETEKHDWPQSVFSHIEPGGRYPRIGKLFGNIGLITGISPSLFLTYHAGYSIFVKQILDPGMAFWGSLLWTGLAMGIAAMSYKFAHECGGSPASKNALIGFGFAPVAILIAFAYNLVAVWTGLDTMMR